MNEAQTNMLTEFDRDFIEAMESVHEAERERDEIFAREFELVKQHINYDANLMDFDALDCVAHVGYVEVEKTDYKESGYQSYDFYQEKDNPLAGHYMRQDDEGEYHNLVQQWAVGISGDSWQGYLLFPLKDGRYWKVEYSC